MGTVGRPVRGRARVATCLFWTAFALGLLAPASVRAEPPATARPVLEKAHVHWYGLYFEQAKAGWMRMTVEPVERDGRALLRVHGVGELHVAALGTRREMGLEEETLFSAAPPYAPVGGHHRLTQGAFTQEVTLQGGPGAWSARITAGGEIRTQALEEPPVGFADAVAPSLWFRWPRAVGDELRFPSFDLADLQRDHEVLTVRARETLRVDGVPLTYYVAEQRSERDGSVSTCRFDEHGTMISMQLGDALEVRLEPEELAKQRGAPVDVFVARIARIDKPLGEAAEVVAMTVQVRGRGVEHLRDGPRQRARYDADAGVLTLELGAGADAHAPATAEERRDALREDPAHPIRDPAVVALAQKAVAGAATPREQVARLVAFVDTFIEDSYSAEPVSVMDILKVRKGDCTEHALLFATLARALGIPAREVGGQMYMGDEVQAFGGHAWDEVLLDGTWVPVDPTWGQTEIDATHIRQAVEGRDSQAEMALGGARLTLVSIERRPR